MSILKVGADEQFTTIQAAVTAAHAGDTIAIDAGTYTAADIGITKDLTIEAAGNGAVNVVAPTTSNPKINVSKGLFIVGTEGNNPNVTIEGLTLSGAKSGSENGAGIRLQSGNLNVVNDTFHDNQDGILATPFIQGTGTLIVQGSTFDHNGVGDAQGHGMYIGYVNTFVLENSVAENAIAGHEVKSRAFNTTIENNLITDTATGNASYSIDLPDGGNSVIHGNTIVKGPQASTGIMIHIGGGEDQHPDSSTLITGNTLVDDWVHPASFTAVWNQTDSQNVIVQGNTFADNNPGTLLRGMGTLASNVGYNAAVLTNKVSTDFGAPGATVDFRGTTGDQIYVFTKPGWTVEGGAGHLTATTQKPNETVMGRSGGVTVTIAAGDGGSNVYTATGSTNSITMDASAIVYSNGNDVINLSPTAGFSHINANASANITVNTASTGTTDYFVFGNATVNEQGGYLDNFYVYTGGTLNVNGTVKNQCIEDQGGTVNFNSPSHSGSMSGYFETGSDNAATMTITTWDNSLETNSLTLNSGDYNLYLDGGGNANASANSGSIHLVNTSDAMTFIGGSGSAYVNTGSGAAHIVMGSGTTAVYGVKASPASIYEVDAGLSDGGSMTVNDFKSGVDHLVLGSGVAITNEQFVSGGLHITTSNNANVVLTGVHQL